MSSAPRTILYTALWSSVGVALLVALFIRSDVDLTVSPVRNPTFVTLSDGSIRNTYDVRLRNKQGEDRAFLVTATSDAEFTVDLEGSGDQTVIVPADATKLQRVYVTAPAGSAAAQSARTDLQIWVEDVEAQERASAGTVFNGREQ